MAFSDLQQRPLVLKQCVLLLPHPMNNLDVFNSRIRILILLQSASKKLHVK